MTIIGTAIQSAKALSTARHPKIPKPTKEALSLAPTSTQLMSFAAEVDQSHLSRTKSNIFSMYDSLGSSRFDGSNFINFRVVGHVSRLGHDISRGGIDAEAALKASLQKLTVNVFPFSPFTAMFSGFHHLNSNRAKA